MERLCPFERKRNGTIIVSLLFFFVVFAPVLRPATLIEPAEAIAETAPIGEPFLFARQQIASCESGENHPRVAHDRVAIVGYAGMIFS